MATKSILKQYTLGDRLSAEKFIKALEQAKTAKRKTVIPKKRVQYIERDKLKEFFEKGEPDT